MKKLYRWIFIIPAGVIAVIIAVANRQTVTFVVDPFSPDSPSLSIDAPLFVIVFIALFIGILIGGGAVWASGSGIRRKARQYRKTIRGLEKEKDAAPPEDTVPALPDTRLV